MLYPHYKSGRSFRVQSEAVYVQRTLFSLNPSMMMNDGFLHGQERRAETMEPFQTLLDWQAPGITRGLPAKLSEIYGGDLQFAATSQPYVIANFASTLDGVVSYGIPGKSSGGEITGHHAGDRFLMALLRASADAVMVGACTFAEAGASHLWTPECLYPEAARLFRDYRAGRVANPLIVIVSGNGNLDISRAVFHTPDVKTLVITTQAGKQRIDAMCAGPRCTLTTRALDAGGLISPETIVRVLHDEFSVRLLLHEGGPMLFGQFLRSSLVNELFLTIAPQMAGRDATTNRPALIRDVVFMPADAPRLKLLSVKNNGDHLFLRYGGCGTRGE